MSEEELEYLKKVLTHLEKIGYIENKGIDVHTLRIISDCLYESGYDCDERLIIHTLAKLGFHPVVSFRFSPGNLENSLDGLKHRQHN